MCFHVGFDVGLERIFVGSLTRTFDPEKNKQKGNCECFHVRHLGAFDACSAKVK
jgi:hypothetical protein